MITCTSIVYSMHAIIIIRSYVRTYVHVRIRVRMYICAFTLNESVAKINSFVCVFALRVPVLSLFLVRQEAIKPQCFDSPLERASKEAIA